MHIAGMAKRPFSKQTETGVSLSAAFHFHVEKTDGCWLWRGPVLKQRGGYGVFTMRSEGHVMARAHRVSFELHKRKLKPGEHVLHTCDNPACVNPNHLIAGNQISNMKDKVAKSRQNRGDSHGRHKLTEAQARAIKKDPRLQREIAADYGVSVITVSDIKRGYSWTHL